ncbi:hypothetical protein TTHERM_000283569 (macronuclear) [Tetrahymena thermophila SB210]|uniref:Uncharacterized protein n=1 Tax=Tetrahymena thermophila (strain SB210) TaxID=312017 RepID=W7XJ58_TETTS|nr:hypothetical protein TTHERM_000283569 [Tetrahymena thermophila SB210]EWS73874.1 hypothetical protein TTHERM_000283569 [Tetrahymena thermophila SB210]|eukprot:XP_012653621.1 hypothetical protein TTHERM_000283569 [Tetrahymena thermophila SB210]
MHQLHRYQKQYLLSKRRICMVRNFLEHLSLQYYLTQPLFYQNQKEIRFVHCKYESSNLQAFGFLIFEKKTLFRFIQQISFRYSSFIKKKKIF